MARLALTRSPETRNARLWGLNGGILVMSFLLSGLTNVVPQLILLRLVPAQKALWLPIALLGATLAALLGTMLGGSRWERASHAWLLLPLFGTALACGALFVTRDAGAFVAFNAGVAFCANLLVTRFDHQAAGIAGERARAYNDRLGTAGRLLGMLLAPWFFAHQLDNATGVVIACIFSCVLAIAAWVAGDTPKTGEAATQTSEASRRTGLAPSEWLFLAQAMTVYAALYVFAANLAYFLNDALHLPLATPRAGTLIVFVFVSALGVVAVAPLVARLRIPGRRSDDAGGRGMSPLTLLPILPLVGACYAYEHRLITTFPGMVGIAVALGLSYGCFLLCLRDHVSRATQQGNTAMITLYNNLANLSALFAFGALLALARWIPGSSTAYYVSWMRLLAALALAGAPLLLLARYFSAQNRAPRTVLRESRR